MSIEALTTPTNVAPRPHEQGTWWNGHDEQTDVLISVEEDAASHLGVTVGSTLTFDLQGQLVTATVESLRSLDWGSLTTNFYVIFSPGALDDLPVTYIATARTEPADDLPLQRAVVSAFPNVTAIGIRHVLDAIQAVLERIALVVRFMAVFTILAGLVVLAGAIATTRYRRIRESAILKTVGATRAVIAKVFAVEYAMLGAVAGLIGAAMATLLAYILLRFFMDVSSPLRLSVTPASGPPGASGQGHGQSSETLSAPLKLWPA